MEPDDASDFPNLQSCLLSGGEFDAVFCISFEQTDSLAKTAQKISEQRFMVDSEVDADNVTNVRFRSEETGFQLGVLRTAGKRQQPAVAMRNRNWVCGGQDNPVINQFAAG